MKKIVAVVFFLFVVAFSSTYGQTMPDLKEYFRLANQLKSPEWDFKKTPFLGDDPTDSDRFSNLTGNRKALDSYLEFALCTYYSAAEKAWAERGNSILPLNNPKLSDQKLGAAVFQEIQILRFLNDTDAVSRHEAILKFITDRKNVTRAEIEAYYRNGIGKLVSDIVDVKVVKRTPTDPATIAEFKQIMTNFLLNPTKENHNILHTKIDQFHNDTNLWFSVQGVVSDFNFDLGYSVFFPTKRNKDNEQ